MSQLWVSSRFVRNLLYRSRFLLLPLLLGLALDATSAFAHRAEAGESSKSGSTGQTSMTASEAAKTKKSASGVSNLPNADSTPKGSRETNRATVEVPEPGALFLVGTGLLSIATLVRNRAVRARKMTPEVAIDTAVGD